MRRPTLIPPVRSRARPLIVGLDIATSCGGADGEPGQIPRLWTWNLREAGEGRPARLAMLAAYWSRYLDENKPSAVFYEAGMTLRVALKVGTTDEVFAMLRGAIGIVEACAYRARVPVIRSIEVQKARRHFIGGGFIPRNEGKNAVWKRCKMLKWPATNLDESDAAAIWALGCALSNPRTAHLTSPLFGGA